MAIPVIVVPKGIAIRLATTAAGGLPMTVSTNGFGLGVTPVVTGGIPVTDTGGTLFGPAVIPANTVLPVITGTTMVGSVLTTSLGTWSGSAASYSFQWDRATPVTYATWDAATVTSVTLSGGNLVATNTGTTSANQGAHVASASGKTSGKYYFEVTITVNTGGVNISAGIGTTASTYTNMGNGGTTGAVLYVAAGSVWSMGSNTGIALGVSAAGQLFGVAVDLDTRKIWFRKGAAGNWNNAAIGSQNPAVGSQVGGVTIPAGTMVPFVTFGGTGGTANNVQTANFGASAFTGAVPSGFTAGWLV